MRAESTLAPALALADGRPQKLKIYFGFLVCVYLVEISVRQPGSKETAAQSIKEDRRPMVSRREELKRK
jgi:hypothetical protein